MHDDRLVATEWRIEGPDPASRPLAPPLLRSGERQTWLAIAGLVLALVLLAGFYGVVKQAMGRAQDHWARAVAAADGCMSDRSVAVASCGQSGRNGDASLLLAGDTGPGR